MNDATSLIVVAGVLALLGAVLLWRGLRGKRHGDHPYCRRCGFNLFGSAQDAKVCPECGADLSVPRAIVIGVKQRRVGLAWTGAGMLVPAVFILLTIIGGTLAGVDWTKRAPPWWLAQQGQSDDKITRDAALAELNSRFTAGTLSNAQMARIVEAGLDYQGHAEKPWSTGWGDLIEGAEKKSLLSADQWQRYMKQAVTAASLKVTLRQRVHPGDPVAYSLETSGGDRVGSGGGMRVYKLLRINGLNIDGTDVLPEPPGGMLTQVLIANSPTGPMGTGPMTVSTGVPIRTTAGGGFSSSVITRSASGGVSYFSTGTTSLRAGISRGSLDVDAAKMSQLAPGMHNGELRIGMKVTPNPQARRSISFTIPANTTDAAAVRKLRFDQQAQAEKDLFANAGPVLAEGELKLPVKIELLAPNEPTVQRIDDEKLRPGVEGSLNVRSVRVLGVRLDAQIMCTNPPVDLSYAVFVRQGEKEWPIGTIAFSKGTSRGMSVNSGGDIILPGQGPDASTVDVVFRPDPAAAMQNSEINSYWGGEVVLKNVALEQPMRSSPAQVQMTAALEAARAQAAAAAQGMVTLPNADPLALLKSQGVMVGGANGGFGSVTFGSGNAVSDAASNGVLLRIDVRPAKDGKAIETASAVTREMLVYPRIRFLQRFTDSQAEGGTTTKISGKLIPRAGADASRYALELEYEVTKGTGGTAQRERSGESINLTLGQSMPFGKSSDSVKTVTITPTTAPSTD